MESISSPLNRLHEDGSWFARAHEVRLLVVRCSGDLRKPVLGLVPMFEFHADNRSPWMMSLDGHTGARVGRVAVATSIPTTSRSIAGSASSGRAVAWWPSAGADGEIVALAGNDGADRGRWRAHGRMVTQLARHPDAGYILSVGLDGKMVLCAVSAPGPGRAEAADARALVDRYPPMARDPEGMPRGSVTVLDAPW